MALSDDAIKNLFDVLRTANLTVTAISLGLLSNVVIALNDVPIKAREELHELLQLQVQVGTFSVHDAILEIAKQNGITQVADSIGLLIDPTRQFLSSAYPIRFPLPLGVHPIEIDKEEKISSFKNLEEYRRFWDALAKNRFILLVNRTPSDAIVTTRQSKSAKVDTKPLEQDGVPGNGMAKLVENPDGGYVLSLLFTVHSFDMGFPLVSLTFGTERKNWDILANLLSKSSQVDPSRSKAGGFDEAFPNLATLGEHYRSLNLADLDAILNEESKQSKGELEVFGAKIPNELVVILGVPLLAVLLLQFSSVCAYLTKNTSSLDADHASQWSFLLRGFGFVLFSFGTTFILPVLSTVLSILFVTSSRWYRWWLWGPIGALVLVVSPLARRIKHSSTS